MYGRLMGKRITGHFFMDHVADDGLRHGNGCYSWLQVHQLGNWLW
jgi:hypothetical protein